MAQLSFGSLLAQGATPEGGANSATTGNATIAGDKALFITVGTNAASGDTLTSVVLRDTGGGTTQATATQRVWPGTTNEERCEIWTIHASELPAAGTYEVHAAFSGVVRAGVQVFELSGELHATTPVRDSSTTPDTAITVAAEDLYVAMAERHSDAGSPEAGLTSRFDTQILGDGSQAVHLWMGVATKEITAGTSESADWPTTVDTFHATASFVPAASSATPVTYAPAASQPAGAPTTLGRLAALSYTYQNFAVVGPPASITVESSGLTYQAARAQPAGPLLTLGRLAELGYPAAVSQPVGPAAVLERAATISYAAAVSIPVGPQFVLSGISDLSAVRVFWAHVRAGASWPYLYAGLDASERIQLGYALDNGTEDSAVSAAPVAVGRHTISIECDGTTLRAYVDTALVVSLALPAGITALDQLNLGAIGNAQSSDFFGAGLGEVVLHAGRAYRDHERTMLHDYLASLDSEL